MEIRKVITEDIDYIARLEKIIEPKYHATKEDLLNRFYMFADGFYVAEEHERIIGYIESCLWNSIDFKSFEEIKDFPKLHNEDAETLYVIYLAVVPAYRRRGIASKLIRRIISLATELGRERVQVVAQDDLRSFYRKLGFKEAKKLPHYLPDKDAVLMDYFIVSVNCE